MTVINTNVGALQARVASLGAQTNMEKAMQRLSSGLRINSAADDAAGLAVATKMESQLRGINMAIRNSNDGISLVQTAESGMAEISNMVIRMRELAVQMNNGIYSDGDRANAQLEVNALLAEIDKISNNTAFNGVKVLDGTYAQDIRAGNTNPEVINVKIDRMNTDTLGGVAITTEEADAVDTSTTYVHGAAKTHATAQEGQVTLSKEQFNENFREFTIANAGGTYTGTGTDSAVFSVNAATGQVTVASGELDFDNPADANRDNKYHFTVNYTVGGETVSEEIELTITDRAAVTASSTTGTSNLTVTEAETISFNAAGAQGSLSDAFKEFVANDSGLGTATAAYSLSGDDAKSYATINLDRVSGLAATDNLTIGATANGTAQTVTVAALGAGDITDSDALGAAIIATSTAAVDFSLEYDTTTNTLIVRNDNEGNSFTGAVNIQSDNNAGTFAYDGTGVGAATNQAFQSQNGGAALLTVDASTGKITAGTGAIDFENPLDQGFNNQYDFTVTYTDSFGKTFAETVALTVADDPTSDAGTAVAQSEVSVSGRSSINISKDNVGPAYFDLNNANHRDLLSQGAKDFIARHAGDNVDALNEVFVHVAETTDANSEGSILQSSTSAVTSMTDVFTTDARETVQSAAITLDTNTAAGHVFTLTVRNHDNTADQVLTFTATGANTLAQIVTGLQDDSDFANADFTLGVDGSDLVVTYKEGEVNDTASVDITFAQTVGTGVALAGDFDAGELDGSVDLTGTASRTQGAGAAKVKIDTDAQTSDLVYTITLGSESTNATATSETFTETLTFSVTQNGAAGTNTFVGGNGRTEQSQAETILTGTSNGEAVVLDLKDRSLFGDMRTYFDAHEGGTFALFEYDPAASSTAYSKSDADDGDSLDSEGSQVARGFELTGSQLTLDAGADPQEYRASVVYTDLEGQTFQQDIKFTTVEAGNRDSASAVLTSSSQTQNATSAATELTGAKSVLEVNEARTGKIASMGQNTQLSAELGQFVGRHTKGSWSLSGADAANFSIDKNGNVESRVLMNFEDKQSHSFNVVYTSGDISYVEQVTLNVVNNTADDGDHIANVDVGTQAGSADAIDILNNALNSITASQAKLGSIQNRLQHNIDNLTALSSQTEIARGRITDADYAAETSQLSKQQILSQAATSMLAQANQSKQGVLALLQ